MKKKYVGIFSGFIFLLYGPCLAETVTMPLTVDYPLLRALVVHQAFTEPDETATIMDQKDGCNRVTLSQPTFREEHSLVRFESRVHIRLGQPMGDNCFMPIEWQGYLALFQRPKIDPGSWTLSFETLDSKVYDRKHQPATIAQALWEIVSNQAYDYLNAIRIDLAPPVSELKSVFSHFIQPAVEEDSMHMLSSIRPGKARVDTHAVHIGILMDVEEHVPDGQEKQKEHISDEKFEQFFDRWEAWDAFLVHMLGMLESKPLSSEDREILLDTLLETRHRFITGLTNQSDESDFVREQFVSAWKRVGPIFRNHLIDRSSKALVGYLAFFTASDALIALDKIGPALKIEISRNGLVRLIHLLGEGESDGLTYDVGINIPLREVLGLGPPPPALGPAFDADALDLIDRHETRVGHRSLADAIGSFLCKPAWAKQNRSADSLAEIKSWLFSKDNLDKHIDRTRSLLMKAAQDTLKKRKNTLDYKKLFPAVVMSTAWQESCFRQFLVKQKKIVYLRSYDGSSVGLMQINERVWRGMYDRHHLRWDIRYNALAGCEIIDLYVTKYLSKHAKKLKSMGILNSNAHAGIIYAMYNGGPGQLDKFLRRNAKGKLYESDMLYMQKYVWIKNGQLTKVSKCLIGQ